MTGAARSSPGQWREYARRLIERTPQASWAELDVATQLCEHFGDVPDDAMNDVIEIGAQTMSAVKAEVEAVVSVGEDDDEAF